jgi:hypothetical protein
VGEAEHANAVVLSDPMAMCGGENNKFVADALLVLTRATEGSIAEAMTSTRTGLKRSHKRPLP